jgi:tetratricopeptide (TPR) repeat protein
MFKAGKSITEINGQVVFYQLLIDCLLRMKSNENDKTELISLLNNEYKGNNLELAYIREFENSYSSDKALRWYTRELFFYKTLNAALRTLNIHIIFLYRSFISDIHRQLKQCQSKQSLRVYRGQLMSIDELHALQKYIDQFISVNSFFSTTIERRRALFGLGDLNQSIDLERVLFEIDTDPEVVTTKPFADISAHSVIDSELEVLFMLGSIFRLKSVERSEDQVWIIRMTLSSDDEHDLKPVFVHMKNQVDGGEANLRTLGNILSKMGKFDLAEKYYTRFVNELSWNDPLLGALYEDLADVSARKCDYKRTMEYVKESIKIKEQTARSGYSNTSETKNSPGKFIERKSITIERAVNMKSSIIII